jgi:hypothetical protein
MNEDEKEIAKPWNINFDNLTNEHWNSLDKITGWYSLWTNKINMCNKSLNMRVKSEVIKYGSKEWLSCNKNQIPFKPLIISIKMGWVKADSKGMLERTNKVW